MSDDAGASPEALSQVFDNRAAEAMKALMETPVAAAEVPAPSEPAVEAAATPEAPKGQEPTVAEPDDAPAWVARAVERITEREQKVAKREKEVPDLVKEARSDLNKFLKERLGLEPSKVARALMAEVLGDNAPAEYRQIKEQTEAAASSKNESESMRAEIQELRSQLEQRQIAEQRQVVVYGAQQDINKYVGGDLKECPTIAKAAKKDANVVKDRIFNEMVKMANERIEAGVEDFPTAAEAAKRVEAEMSKMAALFAEPQNATVPAPVKAKLTAGQTQQSGTRPELKDFDDRARAAMAELLGR